MPPTVHIRLGGPGAYSCNESTSTGGTCILSVQLANMTLGEADSGDGLTDAQRDGEGAMRFIIAVLLVYSLMGTAGMLILRIRQSATKAHINKNVADKEANQYLKQRDKIGADCHKARLVKQTNKALNHIQALERQRSCTETQLPPSGEGDAEQLSPLLSSQHQRPTFTPKQTQASPTSSLTQTPSPAVAMSGWPFISPTLGGPPGLWQPLGSDTADFPGLDLQSPWLLPPRAQFIPSPPTSPSVIHRHPSSLALLPPNLLTLPTDERISSTAPPTCTVQLSTIGEDVKDCEYVNS